MVTLITVMVLAMVIITMVIMIHIVIIPVIHIMAVMVMVITMDIIRAGIIQVDIVPITIMVEFQTDRDLLQVEIIILHLDQIIITGQQVLIMHVPELQELMVILHQVAGLMEHRTEGRYIHADL